MKERDGRKVWSSDPGHGYHTYYYCILQSIYIHNLIIIIAQRFYLFNDSLYKYSPIR